MNTRHTLVVASAATLLAASGHALEVDPNVIPEISIGGRAIVTPAYHSVDHTDGSSDSDSELDIADSSLLFGFSKYLFSDRDYGFGAFGLKLPEDETQLEDDLFVHELHVGVGGPSYEIKLGRSRLTNTLVAFPTLRDDDLLEFTHVANGQSNAEETEEYQIFGGVVQGSWWFSGTTSATAALTARAETDADGERETYSNFNGASLGLAYALPEEIKFDRGLRFAAIAVDYQDLTALDSSPADEMSALIAGLSYNLGDSPEASLILDAQGIYNFGADVDALDEEFQRARAESSALAVALRYAHRPYLQTRWQAALTLGWKDYQDFDDASTFTVTPSFAYRMGAGVELLAQYSYRSNDDGLAGFTGVDDEHSVAVGLSFAFDHTFNESVGERGSILNLEHDTLNFGPIGGGH